MILKFDPSFVLLIISAIMTMALFFYIIKMKNRSQIHFIFLCNIILIFIWSTGHIMEVITNISYGYTNMIYVYIYYFGLCFLPLSLLFTGLIFVNTKLKMSIKYLLFFIIPIIDYVLLITNDIHKLYFIEYSIFNVEAVFGKLFIFHIIFSYIYILVGVGLLIKFIIKNSGFFSKQFIIVLIGIIVPFLVNILQTFYFVYVPVYYTPISFSFAILCFSYAIFKYDFLNVAPIALQKIVDLISDSYLIINKNYDIVDYNKTFIETFKNVIYIKRKDNLLDFIKRNTALKFDIDSIMRMNNKAINTKSTKSFESNISIDAFNKFFIIEVTPIFSYDNYIGTIVLLKDITQSKIDLETIKHNQSILMEKERLASLGQLIGGIAHNLKTPIMSISGGIEAINDLADEYEYSIGDNNVTDDDHKEIAMEIKNWLNKIRPHCEYMSDIISTVKGQAVQFNTSTIMAFTLDELIKRVDLLMKHELKRFHCILNIKYEVDALVELKGDVNSLVQIFDNLIINSIHSYEGQTGEIDLIIKEDAKNILFIIKDYGKGINSDIKDKLFREMITTKGNRGTGLGLYMSYATIKGRFGGDMWFDSEVEKGSAFYITIPYLNIYADRGGN